MTKESFHYHYLQSYNAVTAAFYLALAAIKRLKVPPFPSHVQNGVGDGAHCPSIHTAFVRLFRRVSHSVRFCKNVSLFVCLFV